MFNPDTVFEYLHKGIFLLEEKEFNDFHFEVDTSDKAFCELGEMLLESDEYDFKCLKRIEPRASEILKNNLTDDKITTLLLILDELEIRNSENKEICTMVFASRSFLRTNRIDSYKLPLIFTRFVEDVYMAFANSNDSNTSESKCRNYLNN